MANELPKHHDQHGRDQGTRRIRIRPDSPSGVCVAPGRDVYPGEVCDVPAPVAAQLVAAGRATYHVEPPAPAVEDDVDEDGEEDVDDDLGAGVDEAPVQTPEPEAPQVPETTPAQSPDPAPLTPPRRGGLRRRPQ